MVVVPKKDGKVRLCGDYNLTINQFLKVDTYPLPNPTDLFATLSGGKQFSKLDLSQAYQQMVLKESSCKYVTISTSLGLFNYTQLPFGLRPHWHYFRELWTQYSKEFLGWFVTLMISC